MKKFLAMALVLAMALSALVIPTAADEGTSLTGQANMEVTAYAFGTAPNIDGVITEGEWGKSILVATTAEANDDNSTSQNAKNLYYQNWDENPEIDHNIKFEMWLGWDATYFYIGVVVDDPNGYYAPQGRANVWLDDVLQFRIDPLGPNSIQAVSEDGYDYKTTAFNVDKYSTPWAYPNDVCNIGVADTGKTKTPVQVVDMGPSANNVLLNDGRSVAAGYQSKIAISKAPENAAGQTTYELAIPFAWILNYVAKLEPEKFTSNDDGTFTGIGVGSVLGFSGGILDAAPGSDCRALLTWGSGVFGHQWNKENPGKAWDNGGSNAIVLSNLDAVTGAEVEGLPTVSGEEVIPEHKEMVLYSPMDDTSNYYQLSNDIPTGDDYVVSMDACILDTNIQDESRSTISWCFGSGYLMRGGYDCATQSFMFARNNWGNGFNKDAIVKQSAKFEWAKAADNENGGTWHNLAMKVKGNVATLYCDGVEVLTAEHPAFGTDGNYAEGSELDFIPFTDDEIAAKKAEDPTYAGVPGQVVIFYISAEAYVDNCIMAEGDYDPASRKGTIKIGFNFDADDMNYKKSWARRSYSVAFPQTEYVCNTEDALGYTCGHEWIITGATAEEITHVCDVCGAEEKIANDIGLEPFGGDDPVDPPAAALGDINGDGKWNAKDVAAFLQHSAGWSSATFVEENADYNQDGKVNMKDVSAMMTAIAKNEFGA